LNFMSWSPNVIKGGVVDPDSGLIYSYSNGLRGRITRLVILVVGLLLMVGIVWGIPFASLPGLRPEDQGKLLIGLLAVVVGLVVHIIVARTKSSQSGLPSIFSISDTFLLLDAHLENILGKMALVLIGLFGLVFTNPPITNISVLNFFLVGYTLDSFVEVFINNIDRRATTQVNNLKKQLEVQGS
jgi:hypothetical protein